MTKQRIAPFVVVIAAFASVEWLACINSSNGTQVPNPNPSLDSGGGPPIETIDGSVVIDGSTGGPDAAGDATTILDSGADAGRPASFVTGLGSGVVAHSTHFTIITKTGNEPGGAGVKSSPHFTVVSGAAPAATK